MKHNNKSKKHYNIKKSKGKGKGKVKGKTNKMKMKGGGLLDYFTTMSFNIPGVGSVGQCQSKQILENGEWKEQKCYEVDGNKVYKTVQPDTAANGSVNGAVNGSTNGSTNGSVNVPANKKPWWQFW